MRIEQGPNDTKEFRFLKPGDVFYILRIPDGAPNYYMKIEATFNCNAVNLKTGLLTYFSVHDLVSEYNCVLVADDE